MQEEVWKPVPGYEGLYEASSHGRIRSIERFVYHRRWGRFQKRKSVILKPAVSSRGYYTVVFGINGTRKAYAVHRIIAETFLPNPNNLPVVNHKDEDKTNNAVSNLEWCTQKYNINYGNGLKRRATAQSISKKGKHYSPRTEFKPGNALPSKMRPILCVETGVLYRSMKDACKDCNVSRSTILKSYKTGKTIKGLTFKFTPKAFSGEQTTGF